MDEKRCPLCCRTYRLVRTPHESKALNDVSGPMIVIAGSGMATGGRVLHHLERRLPDDRNAVLLVGFQAEGTRGRSLRDGASFIRMHGFNVPVRARVENVDGLSAHADRNELLDWLRGFERPPGHTYVVHGEAAASRDFAAAIERELGWRVTVARDGATVSLGAEA
jgi:metallo-beta-lactamase family protein